MALKSKTDYNRKNIEIFKINYRKIIDSFFQGEYTLFGWTPNKYIQHMNEFVRSLLARCSD